MVSSADPIVLVDSSAAVPLMIDTHEHHEPVFDALSHLDRGLAGHAAFETYAVLTRLPPPDRRPPRVVRHLLLANFPHTRFLDATQLADLFERLPDVQVAGGSVYDALVAHTAVAFSMPLATCDRRALGTYGRIGADIIFIDTAQ